MVDGVSCVACLRLLLVAMRGTMADGDTYNQLIIHMMAREVRVDAQRSRRCLTDVVVDGFLMRTETAINKGDVTGAQVSKLAQMPLSRYPTICLRTEASHTFQRGNHYQVL